MTSSEQKSKSDNNSLDINPIGNKCLPCRHGGDPLGLSDINKALRYLPEWLLVEEQGVYQIYCEYTFNNFDNAIKFADRVGDAAEEVGHHPKLVVEWGKVTVYWWTHGVKGLHHNDFVMASKTDALFED